MKIEYIEYYCKSMTLDELKERLKLIGYLLNKEEKEYILNYLKERGVLI